MANIDIEKKNKNNNSSTWLWILGILVLAGVIWWIASGNDEPEVEEAAVYEQRISVNSDAILQDDVKDLETELLLIA